MPRSRMLALAASVSMALFSATTSLAADDGEVDIVGFHLGMTVDETKAALAEYGAQITSEQRMYYTYGDGVNNGLKTDDFEYYLTGSTKSPEAGYNKSDSFTFVFSPPPGEQRVVAITRSSRNTVNPPTTDEYRAALVDKYGTPDETPYGLQVWRFPNGKVNCVVSGFSVPGTDILMGIFQHAEGGGFTTKLQNPAAKSLDDCSSYLNYRVNPVPAAPATQIDAQLVDVAGWARASLAANEWVAGLQEAARKARESKSDKPAL